MWTQRADGAPPAPALTLVPIVALLLFARAPESYVFPALYCEDGRDLFAAFYGAPSVASVVRGYGGVPYVALGSTTVAYLVSLFPVAIAPFVYAGLSLLAGSVALSMFALTRLAAAFPCRGARVAAVLLIASLPLGNFALQSSVAYSQFHLLLALIVLSLCRMPRPSGAALACSVAMVLLTWCHPLSPLLVPILLVQAWFSAGRDRFLWLVPTASCVLYAWIGIEHGSQPAHFEFLGVAPLLLIERVAFEGVFGTAVRMGLRGAGLLIPLRLVGAALLLGTLIGGGFLAARRRSAAARIPFWGLAYLVLAITAVSIVVRPHRGILEIEWAQRHTYLPRVLFIVCLVIVVAEIGARLPAPSSRLRVALAVTLAAGVLTTGYQNRRFYDTDRAAGMELRRYLDDVTVLEERAERCGLRYRVRLDRDAWAIPLTVGRKSEAPLVDLVATADRVGVVASGECRPGSERPGAK